MDRGSLVASLQNFRQSLSRQRKLEASLDDLRKLEEEYREGSKKPTRKECDVAPEEAGDNDTHLAEYDEKHKPIQKGPPGIVRLLLYVLCFVILVPAIYALIWFVLAILVGRISETIDVIKSSINEPALGTFLFGGAAVIGAWYATPWMAGIIGAESDKRYKKRLNEYFASHKAARLREYNKDLENQYEKQLNYANEMSLKRAAALPVIEKQERELAEVNRVIAEYDILPEKYKYFDAVDRITEYIRDMRADSIKEAINMYVFERRERSREDIRQFEEERRLEEQREASRRLIEEAERRRKAAEETRDTMKDIKNKLDN